MATQNKSVRSNPTLPSGKPIFSWEAPEFVRYKKSARWFISITLVAIVLGGFFVYQKQWSSVALVAVALIAFTTLSSAKPKKVKCAIYNDGVVVDDNVYEFNKFKSYWMEMVDLPKAKLQLLGRFAGQVALPIADIDPEQIRLLLGKHLPEDQSKGPDIIDQINTILRF